MKPKTILTKKHVHQWEAAQDFEEDTDPYGYSYSSGYGYSTSKKAKKVYRKCVDHDCRLIQSCAPEALTGYPDIMKLYADVEWETVKP